MIVVVTTKKKTQAETETESDTDAPEVAEAEEARADESAEAPEDTVEEATTDEGDERADDDEDEEGGLLKRKSPQAERAKRPWRQYLRRSALPALLVASLAVSGYFGWRQWQDHQVMAAGEQAQQAAIAYAQVLTSIDSNKVDENFKQVLDGA